MSRQPALFRHPGLYFSGGLSPWLLLAPPAAPAGPTRENMLVYLERVLDNNRVACKTPLS
jgi:hypothetical protein